MNAVITVIGKLKAHCVRRKYEKTLSQEQREYARNLRYWLASVKTPNEATGILIKEAHRLQEQQLRLVDRIDRASSQELRSVEDRLKVVQDAQAKRK